MGNRNRLTKILTIAERRRRYALVQSGDRFRGRSRSDVPVERRGNLPCVRTPASADCQKEAERDRDRETGGELAPSSLWAQTVSTCARIYVGGLTPHHRKHAIDGPARQDATIGTETGDRGWLQVLCTAGSRSAGPVPEGAARDEAPPARRRTWSLRADLITAGALTASVRGPLLATRPRPLDPRPPRLWS